MEKRFTYLLGLAKHTENYLMYNELKELKNDVLKFPMLRIEAMAKRITELEQENEFLTAKLEVNGQN
jgi:cell shape-determining protein MreC